MDAHLKALEAESIFIIREAFARIDRLALLWSMGKDSTVLLWLVRKAFFGRVPCPLVLLDTQEEMDEVYAFRDELAHAWSLPVIHHLCPPLDQIDETLTPAIRAATRKTQGLKDVITEHNFSGIFCGIRRDEQGIRAKERVFSPRDAQGTWDYKEQPPQLWDHYTASIPPGGHMRLHPLLAWSELDIWRYIKAQSIPVCSLYFARDGMRYRSLGEKSITRPVHSSAETIDDIIAELRETQTDERSGRLMDRETEAGFETLRVQGYM